MKFLATLIIIISVLSCFLPKHELETSIVNSDVAITSSVDSHQHANGQCEDFESEFCHNFHCVYVFVKDVSIVTLDLPDFYSNSELDQYYFSFKSTLLRPPIA